MTVAAASTVSSISASTARLPSGAASTVPSISGLLASGAAGPRPSPFGEVELASHGTVRGGAAASLSRPGRATGATQTVMAEQGAQRGPIIHLFRYLHGAAVPRDPAVSTMFNPGALEQGRARRAHDDAVADGGGVIYSASASARLMRQAVKAWEKGNASHFLQSVLGLSLNILAVGADHRVYASGSDGGQVVGCNRLGRQQQERCAVEHRVRRQGARHGRQCIVRNLVCTGSAGKTIG